MEGRRERGRGGGGKKKEGGRDRGTEGLAFLQHTISSIGHPSFTVIELL